MNIIDSLEKIYLSIPNSNCLHCHQCCGPIVWFEPEELLIKKFLEEHKIKKILWTIEEFKKNQMRCPYIINNRCIIYPVRPIVCRLQGNIPELKCKKLNNNKMISRKKLNKIRKDYITLIKQTNKINVFYGTLKLRMG